LCHHLLAKQARSRAKHLRVFQKKLPMINPSLEGPGNRYISNNREPTLKPVERLVRRLVHHAVGRVVVIAPPAEAHLWETEFFEIIEHHDRWRANEPLENRLLGKAFQNSRETFTRLERRGEYLHRTYHRALHDLRELQASDPQPEPHNPAAPSVSPEPAAAPSATRSQQTPNPEIGSFLQITTSK
jgi:hypothetical protein